MLYHHRCGRPLWMEWRDHGGSVPIFWDQGVSNADFARMMRCPGCDEKLPDSVGSWSDMFGAGGLMTAGAPLIKHTS